MAQKLIDPRKQFSKRLARWTSVFWFFYMTYLTAMMVIEPQIATAAIWLAGFTSAVMMLNVWAYTQNSVYDKAMYYANEIAKATAGKKDKSGKDDDEGEGGNG